MRCGAEMIALNQETPADWWEVEALFDLCFGHARAALSSYRLRNGVEAVVELCQVGRDDAGLLAAAVRFWPVRVGGRAALLLGPIAVHPTRAGEGLGAMLIGDGLARAAKEWSRVLLVGDASYYGRFGFERLDGVAMPPPTNPARVLGFALRERAWDGVVGEVVAWEL